MARKHSNKEIEVRFLEVDAPKLKRRLLSLGAKDHGRKLLKEIIFYDKNLTWRRKWQFLRLRQSGNLITLTFKNQMDTSPIGTLEIEIEVNEFEKTKELMEAIGLSPYRIQEKKRHRFTFRDVIFEFDTWPKVPTFLEIEGGSLDKLKEGALLLGLNPKDWYSGPVGKILEEKYNIPLTKLTHFTFKKIE